MSPSATASPAAATTFHTFATISARISSAIARTSRLNALVRPARVLSARGGPAGIKPRRHARGGTDETRPRRGAGPLGLACAAPPGTVVPVSAPVALHAVPVRRPARRRGGDMAKKSRKKKARKKSAANHGKRPNS
ncbi:hypothetical protein Asera_30490 [Actinocatenispora sera]|uniref:Uncharacterized protein n=5 Tax=Micromonosporaceae TaxID=28056 RepID=A0A810L3J4_9ACTN|nr:hypothetical protein Asera_30490 [Actinocatenispora sera]